VEKHQGYITAEGKPNEGAHFTISLPQRELMKVGPAPKKQTIL
jgi:signal transduction histidine kinase